MDGIIARLANRISRPFMNHLQPQHVPPFILEEGEEAEQKTEPAPPSEGSEQAAAGGVESGTRPLPQFAEEELALAAARPLRPGDQPVIEVAQRCHVGAVRPRNEDSSLVFVSEAGGQRPMAPFGLFIVADGMGGHHAGHEASRRTSRFVAERVLSRIFLPLLQQHGAGPDPLQEVMLQAVEAANQAIFNPDPEKDMGTTLTAALIVGRRLYLTHVGDSRAYLWHDGQLELLTTDHSYVQRLQDAGQLTPEEAAIHPQRNVLYRAVGQGNDLEIDASSCALPPRGRLLLCSDGLWGLVPAERIKQVMAEASPAPRKAETLVEQALEAGGYDNITAIVVEFSL